MKLFTLKISIFLMALLSFGAGAAEFVFPHATICEPYGNAPASCSVALNEEGYILDAGSGRQLFDAPEYTGAMFTNALYRSGRQYILDSENYSAAKSRRWVVFSYDGKEVVLKHIYIFSLNISMQGGPYWHGYDCRPVRAKLGAHAGQGLLESATDTLCKDVESSAVTIADQAPASSAAGSLAVSVPVYSDGQRNGSATYLFEGTDAPEFLKMACDSNCSTSSQDRSAPFPVGIAGPLPLLCDSSDQAVFQCEVKSGKTLALCAARDAAGDITGLQYRFGREGKIELAYPSGMASSLQKFTINHYVRYRADYVRVAFASGPYNYSIVRNADEDDEGRPRIGAGVTVTKRAGDGKEINLACTQIIKDGLPALFNKLPCDAEDALGCAGM